MKDETTYGLNPEQLARLLAIGLETTERQEKADAGETPAQALQDMLASALPLDREMPDSIPAVLKRPCDELRAAPRQPLRDLLLDPTIALPVIETLKDYSKALVRHHATEVNQAAATAMYYAAIANALAFHDQKITQHSYHRLHEAYAELESRPWIPPELKDLFRRAREVCGQRRRKPGSRGGP